MHAVNEANDNVNRLQQEHAALRTQMAEPERRVATLKSELSGLRAELERKCEALASAVEALQSPS